MGITEKQLEDRQKCLGGSDIPILFGLSRFKSPHDLWLEKTGRTRPEDISDNPAVRAGNAFEEGVIVEGQERLGAMVRNVERRIKGTPIKVHADAMLKESKEPFEVKVEGLFWNLREGWGEEGTDDVPFDVLLQAMTQAMSLDAEVGHIGAFLGGRGFAFYKFGYDSRIAEQILERADVFWNKHVQADIPPEGLPSIEMLKRTIREVKTVGVDAVLMDRYRDAKFYLKEAEEAEKTLKAEILTSMGDAECGQVIADGQVYRMTYKTQARSGFDTKRLKEEHPELASEYVKQTQFNVARFSVKEDKPKKGKG